MLFKVNHKKKTVRQCTDGPPLPQKVGNGLRSPLWMASPCFISPSPTARLVFGREMVPDEVLLQPYPEHVPLLVCDSIPRQNHLTTQLTEEEQMRIAHRMGLYSIYLEEFVTLEERDPKKRSRMYALDGGLFLRGHILILAYMYTQFVTWVV